MKKNTLSIHDHIRLEAYLLSEQAGHPTGMETVFWTQAEALVHGRAAVSKPAKKLVAKKKTATSAKVESPAKATVKAKAKPAGKHAK